MKALNKLSVRLGATPVSLLLLALTVLAVIAIVSAFDKQGEQSRKAQQQVIQKIQITVNKAVEQKQRQLAALASSPELIRLTESGNIQQIERWQKQAADLLPDAKQVCVLLQKVTEPAAGQCLPISFATLSSLRQLQDKSQSDLASLQIGSEQAHILLAQNIKQDAYPDAKVLLALNPTWIDDLIEDAFVSQGYAEITQGKTKSAILTRFGNPQYKTGAPIASQSIANSHWQLQYWSQSSQSSNAWLLILLLSVLVTVLWLVRDLWFNNLLRLDAMTLDEQIADLKQQQLKPKYVIAFSRLRQIRNLIHAIAIPERKTPQRVPDIAVEELTAVEEPTPEPAADESKVNVEPAIDTVSQYQLDVEAPSAESEPQSEPEPEQKEETLLEFNLEQVAHEAPLDLATEKAAPDTNNDDLPDEAIFRAYDVRGVVDKQLTVGVMHQLGQAVGSEAVEQGQAKMVVGRDGRLSSESLSEAFIGGVISTGCDVIVLGEVPTPMVYFACEHLKTHTGAMITGSHNPTNFNGLKVVIAGKTLLGEGVYNLFERIRDKKLKKGQGQRSVENISEAYIERIKGDVQLKRSMRVVVDCGNGVAGHIAGNLLRAIGCDVTELYCDVDGNFPHHHPDPGQPKNMQDLIKLVQSEQAELGLAFDGDGDRLGVVDAEGNIIWPDRLLLLIAQQLLAEQPGATIIYDVKSTSLLEESIRRAGGRPVMSPSGHSVIKNMMTEENAMLAGEMTGHLFFKDRWYGFDDALYSAARLLELLASDQLERTPTEVFAALPQRVSTPEIIIQMKEGESGKFIEQLQESFEFAGGKITTVDGVRVDCPQGWGLVRASNTVPGLTLRFEANNEDELEQIKQSFIQQMLQIKPTLSLLF